MGTLKIAVVGCGNIGKRHLAVLDQEPDAKVVAICDIKEHILREQRELYGSDIQTFANYKEMLQDINADYVSICTPHHLHKDMAIQASNAKINVLVEKPMALCVADCEEMIQAARKNNVDLFVVHQNRFNVPILYTHKILQEGKLGKLFMVQCNVVWNRGESYYEDSDWRGTIKTEGGALHTQSSHFIDLMVWWFGEIVKAQSLTETKNHDIEIEDCGVANVVFETGVIGNIFWTTNAYPSNFEGSITIIAEKGTIKIGGKYLNNIDYWEVQDSPLPEEINFTDEPNTYSKYKGSSSNHDKLMKELIKCFNQEEFELVRGEEAVKTLKAIELIYDAVD